MSNHTLHQHQTLVEIVKPTSDPLAIAMTHSRLAVARNNRRRNQASMNMLALIVGVSGFVALIVSGIVSAVAG